jgi:hypothetical protein
MPRTAFAAWRVTEGSSLAQPIEAGGDMLADFLADVKAHGLCHKDVLFVRETDTIAGQGRLHSFKVTRRSVGRWVTDRGTAVPRKVHDLDLAPLFSVEVDAFEPTPRWQWSPGDVVGIERDVVARGCAAAVGGEKNDVRMA